MPAGRYGDCQIWRMPVGNLGSWQIWRIKRHQRGWKETGRGLVGIGIGSWTAYNDIQMGCLYGITFSHSQLRLSGIRIYREIEPIGCIQICKRFIMRIGSHDYGGWEVPQLPSASWRKQESWWHSFIWVQRHENTGGPSGKLKAWKCRPAALSPKVQRLRKTGASMSEGRRKWRAQLKERERELRPPLPFCFFRALNMLDDSSFLYTVYLCVCVCCHQSCLTLCDPLDCSPPRTVHETLQARILEWVAICFSRGSSQPRDQTRIFCLGGQILYHWATREALLSQLVKRESLPETPSETHPEIMFYQLLKISHGSHIDSKIKNSSMRCGV